ncbi:hypothetical protein BDV96DRAFT_655852 [Lophiotrema nucula]|uniref:Uncharacterized protein n=1 Tax=Lophiotrema nucula TaxID=690887 RepID=A0A6A5YDN9_9PLEO|nr:hypothetical protein BDV96DRAFT_655852 [Lophiotrema nucula]
MLRITLLSTILGLSSLAIAAPTRTQCRCVIVDSSISESGPTSPLRPSSRKSDICSNLGSELEYIQHADPELYSVFVNRPKRDSQAKVTPTEEDLRPLSTAVLMKLATKNGLEPPSAPTERPHQNIFCHSVPEAVSSYHDSQATLIVLQIIVALGILGCIAEGISLLSDWLERKPEETRFIRLPGSERRLRAFSAPSLPPNTTAEKTSLPLECCIEIDVDDDEDDEMNRPVM